MADAMIAWRDAIGRNRWAGSAVREGQVGLTHVEAVVTGPNGKSRSVRFLVDSGAIYSLLPLADWRAIQIRAKRTMTFTLADGTTVERRVSECHFALPEGEGHSPVILGMKGDEALLGAVTLEMLGLVLHPFHRTLLPMRMVLAGASRGVRR